MSQNLSNRLSRVASSFPETIDRPRDAFPWLDRAGEVKVAAATLDAICAFYETTRDGTAAGEAMLFFAAELAARLRDDPAAEAVRLQEFERVLPDAAPTIGRILDAIGWRGTRIFPADPSREPRIGTPSPQVIGV